jgi:hypothetical protein
MNSEQRERVTQLEALTAEVVAYGWKADLYLPAGRLPYLSVYDPADATAHGDVVAMPDSDSGHWWFWFTWAERIALVENLGVAAEIIVGVLRQPVSLAAASSSPSSPGSYGMPSESAEVRDTPTQDPCSSKTQQPPRPTSPLAAPHKPVTCFNDRHRPCCH